MSSRFAETFFLDWYINSRTLQKKLTNNDERYMQGDFQKAAVDYEASSNMFIGLRDIARYSDARANYALTLYQVLFSFISYTIQNKGR